jgi:hypothetical protein
MVDQLNDDKYQIKNISPERRFDEGNEQNLSEAHKVTDLMNQIHEYEVSMNQMKKDMIKL